MFALLGAYMAFLSILGIASYVLFGISHMKALQKLGYQNPWMVWIPFAGNYAIADAASRGEDSIKLIGTLEVPLMLYKLWWLLPLVLTFIPSIGSILVVACNVIFLGHNYIRLYSMLEGKSEEEVTAVGYISGFFPIVAIVKFFMVK